MQLCAENDALKIQELEDRQRIQQLLALTQPVTEEITLFKERIPAQIIQQPKRIPNEGLGASNVFHDVSKQVRPLHCALLISKQLRVSPIYRRLQHRTLTPWVAPKAGVLVSVVKDMGGDKLLMDDGGWFFS